MTVDPVVKMALLNARILSLEQTLEKMSSQMESMGAALNNVHELTKGNWCLSPMQQVCYSSYPCYHHAGSCNHVGGIEGPSPASDGGAYI